MYLIYANDLHDVIKKCGFAFYADDTVLYSVHSDFTKAIGNMKKKLSAIKRGCEGNGIQMNVDKTKYMVFGSKCSLPKVKDFKLKINGTELERVTSYKNLGVTLDPSLNFDKH